MEIILIRGYRSCHSLCRCTQGLPHRALGSIFRNLMRFVSMKGHRNRVFSKFLHFGPDNHHSTIGPNSPINTPRFITVLTKHTITKFLVHKSEYLVQIIEFFSTAFLFHLLSLTYPCYFLKSFFFFIGYSTRHSAS